VSRPLFGCQPKALLMSLRQIGRALGSLEEPWVDWRCLRLNRIFWSIYSQSLSHSCTQNKTVASIHSMHTCLLRATRRNLVRCFVVSLVPFSIWTCEIFCRYFLWRLLVDKFFVCVCGCITSYFTYCSSYSAPRAVLGLLHVGTSLIVFRASVPRRVGCVSGVYSTDLLTGKEKIYQKHDTRITQQKEEQR
jgi:hypothetical protein